QGVFLFANGDQLVGRWNRDVVDGRCVLCTADGEKFEEIWENGERISRQRLNDEHPLESKEAAAVARSIAGTSQLGKDVPMGVPVKGPSRTHSRSDVQEA